MKQSLDGPTSRIVNIKYETVVYRIYSSIELISHFF